MDSAAVEVSAAVSAGVLLSSAGDFTMVASAGAQCDHVNHVSTQLPYAVSCAVISGITYLIAGLLVTAKAPGIISLPIGIVLTLGFLFVMKGRRQSA